MNQQHKKQEKNDLVVYFDIIIQLYYFPFLPFKPSHVSLLSFILMDYILIVVMCVLCVLCVCVCMCINKIYNLLSLYNVTCMCMFSGQISLLLGIS